MENLFHFLKI